MVQVCCVYTLDLLYVTLVGYTLRMTEARDDTASDHELFARGLPPFTIALMTRTG